MYIKKFLKRHPIISKPILFIYHKYKNGHLVRFWYSTHMSPRCKFEGLNLVGAHAHFYGYMGLGSYLGHYSRLNANIGRFSSIAHYVKCINATHPLKEPFATTCPLFYSMDKSKNPDRITFAKRQMFDEHRFYDKETQIDVVIGNDCWVGPYVTFIGGVKVSDGAVVLAYAVVTKDVPPYAIVGGVPAKIIGYRYDEETIDFLLEKKWWNNNRSWFEENWELFCDVNQLKNYYSSH